MAFKTRCGSVFRFSDYYTEKINVIHEGKLIEDELSVLRDDKGAVRLCFAMKQRGELRLHNIFVYERLDNSEKTPELLMRCTTFQACVRKVL